MVQVRVMIGLAFALSVGCRVQSTSNPKQAEDEDIEITLDGTQHEGVVQTPVGRLRGTYFRAGDSIILDDDVTTLADDVIDPNGIAPRGVGLVAAERLWPNGVVPYVFDDGKCACKNDMDSDEHNARYSPIPAMDRINGTYVEGWSRQKIKKAMRMWEASGAIKFVERTNEDRYVRFCLWNRSTGRSRLGRHPVVAGREGQCLFVRRGSPAGGTAHELGHALGLMHEHQRSDRDRFVTIHEDNIEPPIKKGNFTSMLDRVELLTDFGPYDYGSIMHYGARTFGRIDRVGTGNPPSFMRALTIEVKAKGVSIGQRDRPSIGDLESIRMMYGKRHNEVHFPASPIVHAEPQFGGKSFALTASRYDQATLAREGISRVRSLTIPPGAMVRLCESELGECSHHDGRVANYAGRARYVFVERATTITTPTGERRTFRVGSRSTLVDIQSVIVPPGMILRACGTGDCAEATHLMTPPFEPRSRIEVVPAATVFAEERFRGRSRTLRPGLYLASRGEFGMVSSLVAGPGVNVRICNHEEPTNVALQCVDLHGDVVTVAGIVGIEDEGAPPPERFGDSIVRIDVTACVPGTAACPGGGAATCGDGVCRAGESIDTCSRDCRPASLPPTSICERQPWKCEDDRQPRR